MMDSTVDDVLAIAIFDIDGVIRDVGGSYRRALADTVEQFTQGAYRPSMADIDALKAEGIWNNDWEASRELVYRYFREKGVGDGEWGRGKDGEENPKPRTPHLDYEALVAFFQSRYRGSDPEHWTGYICDEPLLVQPEYLESLTAANIRWGFFSGATRGSARYVLEKRLGLQAPPLIAMEDGPGKPDPTGLLQMVRLLETADGAIAPRLYVGDTVADMHTINYAREYQRDRQWIGVGIVPPHAHQPSDRRDDYANTLKQAGAAIVLNNVQELTPAIVQKLVGQE